MVYCWCKFCTLVTSVNIWRAQDCNLICGCNFVPCVKEGNVDADTLWLASWHLMMLLTCWCCWSEWHLWSIFHKKLRKLALQHTEFSQGDQPRLGEMLPRLAYRPSGQGGGQGPVQGLRQHSCHHQAGERREVPNFEEEVLPWVLCGHLLLGHCHTKWLCRAWFPRLSQYAGVAWGRDQLWRGPDYSAEGTVKFLSRTAPAQQVTR